MTKNIVAVFALLATAAFAHHGWSGYDESKPVTLTGVVQASGYENPHAYVDLQVKDNAPANGKMWHAVLAPVSRMSARGITKADIAPGATVTVEGFQDKSKVNELKIERITIKGKKYEIRR